MTEVMDSEHNSSYHQNMKDFAAWLHNLSAKPLPGGVSAAALAAAMGAALLAKTARVSLHQQDMIVEDRATMQAALDLASHQQQALVELANADEQAYRAVLAAGAQPDPRQPEGGPWLSAIEVPIGVAETCHLLLQQLPGLQELCLPVVRPDLDIGRWLLEAGLRTGILAAKSNMQAWADKVEMTPLEARLAALEPGGPQAPEGSPNP